MSTDYKNEFGGWVIRFRWWIILFAIVFVFAAASGARFLGFSTDIVYFSARIILNWLPLKHYRIPTLKTITLCLLWNPKTAMFFHVRRWQL